MGVKRENQTNNYLIPGCKLAKMDKRKTEKYLQRDLTPNTLVLSTF